MATNDRPLVGNAASPKQVARAQRKEKDQRARELSDLLTVLSTEAGRRLIWRLLGYCKTFSDIWDPSSRIHFNAGLQNVGHFLLAEINAADEEKYFLMMREAQATAKREQIETEAAQTPSSTDVTTQEGEHNGERSS